MLSMISRFALLAAACGAPMLHAAPDWSSGVGSSVQKVTVPGVARPDLVERLADTQWERVEGCARTIAAGAPDQVMVVGCGGQYAADGIYVWQGGRFVAEPQGSVMLTHRLDGMFVKETGRVASRASWLAIDGVAGKVFAIGPDFTLYSRPWASPYAHHQWNQFIGAQAYTQPAQMTAVAAGGGRSGGALWAITAQPAGPGGNKIYTSELCPAQDRIVSGRCWKGVEGAAQKVAIGHDVWVVSTDGGIFRRDGNSWTKLDGCARDIAANGDHVYVVGCDGNNGGGEVYRRFNNKWVNTRQSAKTLAVDAAGTPWLVKATGEIWRRKPLTPAPIR